MSGALARICCLHRASVRKCVLSSWESQERWSLPALTLVGAAFHASPAVSAGHNKWSKVKHIKGPKDEARARLFAKLSMMIRVAVREGGPNPEANDSLSQVIEMCRQKNMPKNTIETAIKGAEKAKPSSHLLYEARGPGHSSLLIEILTDNKNRSYAELRSIMNKNGGSLSDAARHYFDKKGVVTIQPCDKEGAALHLDRALELAIEAGAEDVQEVQDEEEKVVFKYICDIPSLRDVRSGLTSLGLVPFSSGYEFLPNTTVRLSDDDMATASKLLEILSNHSDVIRVFDNIE